MSGLDYTPGTYITSAVQTEPGDRIVVGERGAQLLVGTVVRVERLPFGETGRGQPSYRIHTMPLHPSDNAEPTVLAQRWDGKIRGVRWRPST